jgi:MFS transporter, DHA2 family, lincomycin resistance protein
MKIESERKIDLKLILSIIATGIMSFTGVVIETAMNITFPTLMQEFQVNTSTVQWMTTGYLLMLSIIIPASSYLKKRFTTKALFLTALILFTTGTIINVFGDNFPILILGRFIQGAGTGVALPLMFNIILEQVPLKKLGFMMGIATFITATAPAIGPSFGGFIVNQFGWRMIFVSVLPILIISCSLGLYAIRQVSPVQTQKFDWIGYLLLAIAFSSLIIGMSASGINGWLSVQVILPVLVTVICLFGFCKHSLKTDHPIIHLKILKSKPFTFSVLNVVMISIICLGLGLLIPNYSQIVGGENAFLSGSLLVPGCILAAILAPISGRILDTAGPTKPLLIGNTLIIVAILGYVIFVENLTSTLFVVFYLFFAGGQGFAAGTSMTNGLKHVQAGLTADGNAIFTTMQQLSGAIGTALVASLVSSKQALFPNDLATGTVLGTRNSFFLLLILAIVGLVCTLVVLKKSKKQELDLSKNSQDLTKIN